MRRYEHWLRNGEDIIKDTCTGTVMCPAGAANTMNEQAAEIRSLRKVLWNVKAKLEQYGGHATGDVYGEVLTELGRLSAAEGAGPPDRHEHLTDHPVAKR